MNFKANVYPVLRCCERYLQQLPLKYEEVRSRFKGIYDRAWERFTGRKPGFREEFELNRRDTPLRREKPLQLGKNLVRGLFRDH